MARTSTATTNEPKTPTVQAYHVTNKGDVSFWNKVGAPHGPTATAKGCR